MTKDDTTVPKDYVVSGIMLYVYMIEGRSSVGRWYGYDTKDDNLEPGISNPRILSGKIEIDWQVDYNA